MLWLLRAEGYLHLVRRFFFSLIISIWLSITYLDRLYFVMILISLFTFKISLLCVLSKKNDANSYFVPLSVSSFKVHCFLYGHSFLFQFLHFQFAFLYAMVAAQYVRLFRAVSLPSCFGNIVRMSFQWIYLPLILALLSWC